MGTFFISELDSPLVSSPEDTGVFSKSYSVDASPISSMVLSGTEGRGFTSIKLEMEGESALRCKRLKKLITTAQQCIYLNVPEKSPLGLTLRKTPSFVNLVETKLSQVGFSSSESKYADGLDVPAQQNAGKTKASNLCASLLRIGSWERVSRYEGELVAKCYYAKQKLVWEVLDSGLKNKIELLWSNIASLKATLNDGEPETLEIELLGLPFFFRETNPQPRKHTLWKATADFTGGQASIYRRHLLQFPRGTLQKHYEKLLNTDERLASLSKKPYPILDSPFFGLESRKNQQSNSHQLFRFEEQNSNMLKQFIEQATSSDFSEHSQNFTLSSSSPVLRQLSKIEHPILEAAPPNAVAALSSGDVKITNSYDGQQMARIPFWEAMFTGASDFMGHDTTSIAITNMFPNIFGSFLPSITDEIHPYREDEANDTRTETLYDNLDVLKPAQGRYNHRVNSDKSAVDLESSCHMSDIQANWNLVFPVGLSDNFGYKSEIDGYVNVSYEISCPREVSGEISSKRANFLENLSSITSLPVFFVEDPVVSNEAEEEV